MHLIGRYIFRRAATAFVATISILTAIVWATQALRQLDLVTAKGQTIGLFLELTLLALPFLILVIAPFALVIALVMTLNSLNAENELVVMSSAGASRWAILKPFLTLAVLVALLAGLLSTVIAPAGLRQLRYALTNVRVDLVATIVQPGRFIEIEDGLTFHVRDRGPDGSLIGLMMDDERDPTLSFTYLADRGRIVEAVDRTLLVMTDGTIQRRRAADGAIQIIRFQAYAFDLSNLMPSDTVEPVFKPSERMTPELLVTETSDDYARRNSGRFRSELHDRLTQPLYPIAFTLIVFLFLGDPRTTRQGRALSVLGAIVVVAAVRMAGFGATTLAIRSDVAVVAVHLVPLAAILATGALILGDARLALPRPASHVLGFCSTWCGRMFSRVSRQDEQETPSS
ncbi:LPS export ABC transporter permease LptF [Segnochrobactraceae bacterium EtOH-i3]